MTALDKGEVQAVIASDMTRLTRNARDTLRIIETAAACVPATPAMRPCCFGL